MPAVVILVGLAYGILIAAVGLALWSGRRGAPRLSRGAEGAAWVAGGLLVFGALLAWGSRLPALEWLATSVGTVALEGPVASMILMAAVAIPFESPAGQRTHWSRSLLYVPALLLSGVALVRTARPGSGVLDSDWITPIRFSLAVCAGLGARTLGRALQVIAAGIEGGEELVDLTYGLLTLVAGSAALVSLWQRGTAWTGADPVVRGGVVGTWLAWSASWLARSWPPRLRATLTTIAALLLILVATKGA